MPTIQDRFVMRRGLAADLASVNEVPLQGEWILTLDAVDDSHRLKIGDGTTHYNDLPYAAGGGGASFALYDTDTDLIQDTGSMTVPAKAKNFAKVNIGGTDYLLPLYAVIPAPPTTDPYWANVVSLLHFDGTAGATTFTDEKGIAWTAGGSAKVDASVAKFGQSADLRTDPSYLDTPLNAAFFPGTQDFCIEAWVRLTAITAGQFFTIASATEPSGPSYGWRFVVSGASLVLYCYDGAGHVWSDNNAPLLSVDGTFHHVAFSRQGTTGRYFVDGVMGASPAISANSINIAAPASGVIRVGAWGNVSGRGLRGWVDDFRLTVGAARYTASFTPPSAPFPTQ